MVDVTDTQTIVSTINKVYTWGNLKFNDFDPDSPNYQSWKRVNNVQIPSGKINKIHAHPQFSVVEIQNHDHFVIGNQKMFEEDCSSKEWKTLTESFIIINGVVLTLKKIEFSRINIS